jgi:hypothetical protein
MPGIVLPHSITPKEVRERLMAIADAAPDEIVNLVTDQIDCPIATTDLPALLITGGGAPTRVVVSKQQRQVTRTYGFRYLVYELCNDSEAEQLAAIDATLALLDELPDWFAKAPRLELDKAALNGVHSTGHLADDGFNFIHWAKKDYGGVDYRLEVTTNR